MVERYGIDVSRWQGVIDWPNWRKMLTVFCYTPRRFSCAYDSKFKEYIKEVKRVKIPFGLYLRVRLL